MPEGMRGRQRGRKERKVRRGEHDARTECHQQVHHAWVKSPEREYERRTQRRQQIHKQRRENGGGQGG